MPPEVMAYSSVPAASPGTMRSIDLPRMSSSAPPEGSGIAVAVAVAAGGAVVAVAGTVVAVAGGALVAVTGGAIVAVLVAVGGTVVTVAVGGICTLVVVAAAAGWVAVASTSSPLSAPKQAASNSARVSTGTMTANTLNHDDMDTAPQCNCRPNAPIRPADATSCRRSSAAKRAMVGLVTR